ncbi:MAG: response regulator [Myxococcota bacterium]
MVDDDKALTRTLVRAVEAAGYPVEAVHDGDAAVQSLQRQVPGMVLLDLLLPRRDGRSVLAWLRDREATRSLPVVVMSGVFKSRSHGKELVDLGAQAFLDKPFRRSDLEKQLRRHLGRPPAAGSTTDTAGVSLADRTVPEVLWEAMQEGYSGALEFRRGRRLKVLILDKGRPTSIRSNLARECLGQRLAAHERIGAEDLEESVRRLKTDGKRQGEVLVDLGALTREELDAALADQAEEKLMQLFTWTEGEATRSPDVTELTQASSLEGWSARRTILRGVERMSSARAERALAAFRERPLFREDVSLDESEAHVSIYAALLDDLDGTATLKQLAVNHARPLLALALIGAVPLRRAESEAEVSLASLEERLEATRDQSYFEILGVSEDARTAEIRKSFLELAKRFHPDRIRSTDEHTLAVAADLFARMSEAHDTLCDAQQRRAYCEALRARSGGGEGPAATQVVAAEMQFQKGEALFRKRDYPGALEHFRQALDLYADEGEFHAYFGWTQMLVSPDDDEVRAGAKASLEQAIRLAPQSATCFYFFGLQRRACGDTELAERMFRKVLELDPKHVEASRELRLAQMRREKPGRGEGGGGLFGFARKK